MAFAASAMGGNAGRGPPDSENIDDLLVVSPMRMQYMRGQLEINMSQPGSTHLAGVLGGETKPDTPIDFACACDDCLPSACRLVRESRRAKLL